MRWDIARSSDKIKQQLETSSREQTFSEYRARANIVIELTNEEIKFLIIVFLLFLAIELGLRVAVPAKRAQQTVAEIETNYF